MYNEYEDYYPEKPECPDCEAYRRAEYHIQDHAEAMFKCIESGNLKDLMFHLEEIRGVCHE